MKKLFLSLFMLIILLFLMSCSVFDFLFPAPYIGTWVYNDDNNGNTWKLILNKDNTYQSLDYFNNNIAWGEKGTYKEESGYFYFTATCEYDFETDTWINLDEPETWKAKYSIEDDKMTLIQIDEDTGEEYDPITLTKE